MKLNMKEYLHCIALNARGLNEINKQRKLFKWASDQKIDVFLIQETHLTNDKINKFDFTWNGDGFHSFGTPFSRGVSILLRKDIEYKLIDKLLDCNGRYLLLKVLIQGITYVFVNVYAPNDSIKQEAHF